jgi:hypothetical protein
MKKNSLIILGLATLVFALVLSSCGANPKSLAKQTYDLYEQVIVALDNPLKLPGVMVKAASLGKKVNKLSERDRQIYSEELASLGGAGLDSLFGIQGTLGALFGDGAGLDSLSGILEMLGALSGDGAGSAQSGDGVKPAQK